MTLMLGAWITNHSPQLSLKEVEEKTNEILSWKEWLILKEGGGKRNKLTWGKRMCSLKTLRKLEWCVASRIVKWGFTDPVIYMVSSVDIWQLCQLRRRWVASLTFWLTVEKLKWFFYLLPEQQLGFIGHCWFWLYVLTEAYLRDTTRTRTSRRES